MFRWLNKQGVESDAGFIVQSVSRFTIEYRENSKCISIEVNPGYSTTNKPCEIIDLNSLEKWDDGSYISKQKQSEILKNFTEAMKFQDIEVIFNK